jgi:hypothetical protein
LLTFLLLLVVVAVDWELAVLAILALSVVAVVLVG